MTTSGSSWSTMRSWRWRSGCCARRTRRPSATTRCGHARRAASSPACTSTSSRPTATSAATAASCCARRWAGPWNGRGRALVGRLRAHAGGQALSRPAAACGQRLASPRPQPQGGAHLILALLKLISEFSPHAVDAHLERDKTELGRALLDEVKRIGAEELSWRIGLVGVVPPVVDAVEVEGDDDATMRARRARRRATATSLRWRRRRRTTCSSVGSRGTATRRSSVRATTENPGQECAICFESLDSARLRHRRGEPYGCTAGARPTPRRTTSSASVSTSSSGTRARGAAPSRRPSRTPIESAAPRKWPSDSVTCDCVYLLT